MKKILVVDDEQAILTLLEYNLEQAGYEVETVDHGNMALDMIMDSTNDFDFIVLDIMLPGIDGMEICRRVRQEKIKTPILMLTAKDDEYDKVIGLELGADDYMTKPFSPRELIARIKAVSRRTASIPIEMEETTDQELPVVADIILDDDLDEENIETLLVNNSNIKLGRIEIFTDRYEVLVDDVAIDVTPKEFDLLVYMALRKGRIISREQLLNNIWDYDYAGETRIVDVHISHLREKIEKDTKNPEYIKTVRGFGYRFEVPGENEE